MRLTAVEHIRALRGSAQAHLMRADDGGFYVVKFWNNPQHPRVLANEMIAASLARAVGLSVPDGRLIDVPPSLIHASPQLCIHRGHLSVACASGVQFASRLAGADPRTPIYDYLPAPALTFIANRTEFAGALLFDQWTSNVDARQFVFARKARHQPLHAFLIDHGLCFNGDRWNLPDSPLYGIYHSPAAYAHIAGWHSFQPWLDRIESLSDDAIFSAAIGVPQHWYGDRIAVKSLLERLIRRQKRLRELLWLVKSSPFRPFPNWTQSQVYWRRYGDVHAPQAEPVLARAACA